MHQPPPPDRTHTIARNARYGIWLFLVYVAFYAGFVILSAFRPGAMAADVGGVNLAIAYGMGLILLAFVLALVYMAMTVRDHAGDPAAGSHAAVATAADPDAEGRA